uniref:Uncharacterized protein n=1 Tax=Cacopsylla melanoneura TaxID=428564 RepID=A0A8D8R627_9HEMI
MCPPLRHCTLGLTGSGVGHISCFSFLSLPSSPSLSLSPPLPIFSFLSPFSSSFNFYFLLLDEHLVKYRSSTRILVLGKRLLFQIKCNPNNKQTRCNLSSRNNRLIKCRLNSQTKCNPNNIRNNLSTCNKFLRNQVVST